MKEIFTWDESYCVGDKEIDDQHRKLFEFMNSFPEDMSQEDIKGYILILIKHAREHFRCEEALMERVNYPSIDNHKERHTELLQNLSDKCLEDFHGKFAVHKFKVFVYHWIDDHILNTDSALFDYVRNENKESGGFDFNL